MSRPRFPVVAATGLAIMLALDGLHAAGGGAPEASAAVLDCLPGEPCLCNGSVPCERTCVPAAESTKSSCAFACEGAGSCTFHCPLGGCTAVASGTGAAELTCEGGGCTLKCSGTAACALNDCPHDCHVVCTGAGVCSNDCAGARCSCRGENCER